MFSTEVQASTDCVKRKNSNSVKMFRIVIPGFRDNAAEVLPQPEQPQCRRNTLFRLIFDDKGSIYNMIRLLK